MGTRKNQERDCKQRAERQLPAQEQERHSKEKHGGDIGNDFVNDDDHD